MTYSFTGQRNPAYAGDMAAIHIGCDIPEALAPTVNTTGAALATAPTGTPAIEDRPVFRDVDTADPAARFGTTILFDFLTWALPDFTDGACVWTRNTMTRDGMGLVLHTCYPSLTTDPTTTVTGWLLVNGGTYEFTIPPTTAGVTGDAVPADVDLGPWWPADLLYPPPIDHSDAMDRLAAWRSAPIP